MIIIRCILAIIVDLAPSSMAVSQLEEVDRAIRPLLRVHQVSRLDTLNVDHAVLIRSSNVIPVKSIDPILFTLPKNVIATLTTGPGHCPLP
jgi:hypothetical protein